VTENFAGRRNSARQCHLSSTPTNKQKNAKDTTEKQTNTRGGKARDFTWASESSTGVSSFGPPGCHPARPGPRYSQAHQPARSPSKSRASGPLFGGGHRRSPAIRARAQCVAAERCGGRPLTEVAPGSVTNPPAPPFGLMRRESAIAERFPQTNKPSDGPPRRKETEKARAPLAKSPPARQGIPFLESATRAAPIGSRFGHLPPSHRDREPVAKRPKIPAEWNFGANKNFPSLSVPPSAGAVGAPCLRNKGPYRPDRAPGAPRVENRPFFAPLPSRMRANVILLRGRWRGGVTVGTGAGFYRVDSSGFRSSAFGSFVGLSGGSKGSQGAKKIRRKSGFVCPPTHRRKPRTIAPHLARASPSFAGRPKIACVRAVRRQLRSGPPLRLLAFLLLSRLPFSAFSQNRGSRNPSPFILLCETGMGVPSNGGHVFLGVHAVLPSPFPEMFLRIAFEQHPRLVEKKKNLWVRQNQFCSGMFFGGARSFGGRHGARVVNATPNARTFPVTVR